MRYEFFLSSRYLVGHRGKFISVTTAIATLGVALGVTALIVVLAVMSGFDEDLKEKITGANPHLLIEQEGGIADVAGLLSLLESQKQILGVAPLVQSQALLLGEGVMHGVLLRGIDPKREKGVTQIGRYLKEGHLDLGQGEILIGNELARKLAVFPGDAVRIVSPVQKQHVPFRVAGIFQSGMYDYDLNLAMVSLGDAQSLLGMDQRIGAIGVRLVNLDQTKQVQSALRSELGPTYLVTSWIDLNRNLFGALALEKATMFVILTLIVLVACFTIAATLMMMVMEKTKDIGILKSLGSTNASIRFLFSLQGLWIGGVGTFLGALGGLGLCLFLKKVPIVTLPQDIYYIDRLPVQIQWGDSLLIVAASLGISWLSTLYPAWQAARLDPVDALRCE